MRPPELPKFSDREYVPLPDPRKIGAAAKTGFTVNGKAQFKLTLSLLVLFFLEKKIVGINCMVIQERSNTRNPVFCMLT